MRHLRDAVLPRQAWLASPTPRTTQDDLCVTCNACLRSVYADLPGLIAAGYGDVPLRELRFRCASCGSSDTFVVVSGARDARY